MVTPAPRHRQQRRLRFDLDKALGLVRILSFLILLSLGIWVTLSPGVVYAPTPRTVLYFLLSLIPAIIFGAEASSRFEFRLPGFCFTTAGAFAVCLGTLFLLTHLSKPEEKIAVYQIYDESGQKVALDWSGAVEIPVTANGLTVTKFIEGNSLIVIFPEQVDSAELRVKTMSTGPAYVGLINYAGSKTSAITLGQHLKIKGRSDVRQSGSN